ncbi:hypothetical protein [Parafrankia sp. EUN1f]|uniref:hypothetical protein n=1 Tax=Parafrankia sp. EUN1f TaxID=102897 RepID=UPI0001C43E88|nr:hypothetical protein [Parafrankia sp. EUN1f]EFC84833.1 hypothetical protein FrEUN1fDRAFT_2015 [Parafrankia sp. EUN1f]
MKFPRLLAGLGLAVLTGLAGTACTSHAGAAAQVGSSTIETSTVRGIVDRGLAAAETAQTAQTLTRTALQRRTITMLVDLKVRESAAKSLGVTVSDQDLNAFYQASAVLGYGGVKEFETNAAALGYAKEDLLTAMRVGALEFAIADKVAPTTLASPDYARAQYDGLVQQHGELPLTYEAARPYLQRFLASDQRNAKIQPVLTDTANRLGVSVNPRFGEWNAKESVVDEAPGTIATTEEPVASTAELTL